MENKLKLVYCTPSLYISGGLERVLTLKVNYFAEHFDYDITIILTDGFGKPYAYPLSEKVKVINLNIEFDELWKASFLKKVFLYLKKQRQYKRKLREELMRIRPDITDSLIRREINFLNSIKDGSRKIGEIHVNRLNYRNFESNDTNWFKDAFAKIWMNNLLGHLKKLDRFVVLTEEDKIAWKELENVVAIHNPISFSMIDTSPLTSKRFIAIGRYTYQKGFDLLLKAWKRVEKYCPEWELVVFGDGNRSPYIEMMEKLSINPNRCHLYPPTKLIQNEYMNSSIFVVSSRFEGLSMALLEAISYGLPVVSFSCPCGPRDVISEGVNGILVPAENTDSLAEAMIKLSQAPEQIKRMGENARKRSEDFKLEVIAEKWKNLFESLC